MLQRVFDSTMDDKTISPKALVVENSKPEEQEEDGEEGIVGGGEEEEEEDEVDDETEQRQLSELESSVTPIRDDSGDTQLETLTVSGNDLQPDLITNSHQLSKVPVKNTLRPHESTEFKIQGRVSQQQALTPGCPTSSLELSPTSVTQSVLSVSSPTLPEQRVSSVGNNNGMCLAEVNRKNTSDSKSAPAAPNVKASSSDGYNWRKYGQKQVKSPQGSRSYYKCTYSECFAKKIECCYHSSSVIEIIYKSHHNHDPPRKINCTRENSLALSVLGSNNTSGIVNSPKITDPTISSRETIQETPPVPEIKHQNLACSDGNAGITIEEHPDEPEPKRRLKKSSSAHPVPLLKPGKIPKFVVHAAGDVGISGDGYRWRKYGQKMVKGNPHPRNYYRCTSAGCPVRKHIERATDNTSAVVITYKGIHDHDMPVPKKRHGPPSAPLVSASAPSSMINLQTKRPVTFHKEVSATQWSVGKEGELTGKALDLGGEKAIESARTLLSIGFEIKRC